MKRQDGAALIVVLGIVAISTMIGLASMQSSQIDEKMAGNYKLATQANLLAERAAMAVVHDIVNSDGDFAPASASDVPPPKDIGFKSYAEGGGSHSCRIKPDGKGMTAAACYVEGEKSEDNNSEDNKSEDNDIIAAVFRDKKPVGQPLRIQVTVKGGGTPGGAYSSVLLGCEGVNVSSGGFIDSYDSRKGAYGVMTDEGINSNGTKATISTNQANGDVTISGGGVNVYGDVSSQGAVKLIGSGTIHGNVVAGTEIVTGNWSSRIDGNATAPVVRTTTNRDVEEQVGGEIVNSDPGVPPVATSNCDSFTASGKAKISDLIAALSKYPSSGNLTFKGASLTYTLTPDGLQAPVDSNSNEVPHPENYQVTPDVMIDGVFPEPTNVLVLDSFSLAGSANFVVDGGDMTLYVKGDVNIGGGATFSIAEGSSLKIVTDGRFSLPSGLDVASDSPTDEEGNPILSLYSTYDDSGSGQPGVSISGASDFKGTIFAPDSEVAVTGSGTFYGAAKGRKVTVSGAGAIHYDEALMESTVDTGGGSAGGKGGGGFSFTWL